MQSLYRSRTSQCLQVLNAGHKGFWYIITGRASTRIQHLLRYYAWLSESTEYDVFMNNRAYIDYIVHQGYQREVVHMWCIFYQREVVHMWCILYQREVVYMWCTRWQPLIASQRDFKTCQGLSMFGGQLGCHDILMHTLLPRTQTMKRHTCTYSNYRWGNNQPSRVYHVTAGLSVHTLHMV